jgi:hypothetical protein
MYRELAGRADDEVMRHLAAGHDDVLSVLFDRYHRLVLKVSLRIVRDPGEAQDVTLARLWLPALSVVCERFPDHGVAKRNARRRGEISILRLARSLAALAWA